MIMAKSWGYVLGLGIRVMENCSAMTEFRTMRIETKRRKTRRMGAGFQEKCIYKEDNLIKNKIKSRKLQL